MDIMQYWQPFLVVAALHLAAVISPGPDFLLIAKLSLSDSRENALWAAAGLATGIALHVTWALLGIALIIAQSAVLYMAVKYLCAGYLLWLGFSALRSDGVVPASESKEQSCKQGARSAYLKGLLTNALNPKATAFFLAVFAQVVDPGTPLIVQTIYGAEMSLATLLWFASVACLLSVGGIKARFIRYSKRIDQAFGALLLAFGLKIALSDE
jgi:RhtB (resistance to homoserine/threonine) family protein